ncbi:GAF and ANTAR domain-containing protein [Streptomyces tauricus]|uniref:GAF and ANTAR domain-containing protein n=1 Tax=Streptomyces tauricus TaxID=68274 RepID=UPI00380D76F4
MAQFERDERLARAFLELADTMVAEFDLVSFLHVLTDHVVELAEVTAAGIIMVDAQGRLVDVTASTDTAHRLEEVQIEYGQGPCRDCCYTHEPVGPVYLDQPQAAHRWPRFAPAAREAGFAAVAALPLRLREETIGALNLFHTRSGKLDPAGLRLGQALADAATIGILHQRLSHDQAERTAQLQSALNSRIVIEQAKGALAVRLDMSPDDAFQRIRAHARSNRTSLTRLCHGIVNNLMDADSFATPPDTPRTP